jgi:hypothetical protein
MLGLDRRRFLTGRVLAGALSGALMLAIGGQAADLSTLARRGPGCAPGGVRLERQG